MSVSSSLGGGGRASIAVVIPAGDAPATLDRCLAALAAGERQPDETVVQSEPAGAGPAQARNAGAARSGAELLVFVDSDVEVHPDALARIERHFAADPALAAVFGAYDQEPAAPGLTSRFRNLLHHHVHASSAGEAETFWAGLGAIRRDSFEAVEGFDEARFPGASVEDIDLGMRLRGSGHRILLDPAISGCHLKAWTPLSMVRTDFSRRGVPWVRLVLRERRGAMALNLGWRHRFGALASALLVGAILIRRPRAALAALLALVALNRRLYALLARRGGPSLLLAGIGLHVVHQLTAIAAVPAAIAVHLREGRR
ncbi:MAG TPA: glycosyltransferase family A protein [Solirubrobacterales bacterium]|nr:glycosyltransferase family A protein [Solirubrobacterales bacterium]